MVRWSWGYPRMGDGREPPPLNQRNWARGARTQVGERAPPSVQSRRGASQPPTVTQPEPEPRRHLTISPNTPN